MFAALLDYKLFESRESFGFCYSQPWVHREFSMTIYWQGMSKWQLCTGWHKITWQCWTTNKDDKNVPLILSAVTVATSLVLLKRMKNLIKTFKLTMYKIQVISFLSTLLKLHSTKSSLKHLSHIPWILFINQSLGYFDILRIHMLLWELLGVFSFTLH